MVFMIGIASAECQYKDYIEGNKSVSNLYVNGTKQENVLEIKNTYTSPFSGWHGVSSFEVHSNSNYLINVKIRFLQGSATREQPAEIEPHGFVTIIREYADAVAIIYFDTIEIEYLNNSYTEARWEKEIIGVTCRQCAGQTCLNDGEACDYSFQCGGGYCIEGICLNENDTFNLNLGLASNVSALESWKLTIEAWKLTITSALVDLWSAINGHATRIAALENKTIENKTIIINNTLIINNTFILNNTLPNYFKYSSSSDRKKMVCGYGEEKHLTSIIDLGWNCTITYRLYRTGEKAVCRCREVK